MFILVKHKWTVLNPPPPPKKLIRNKTTNKMFIQLLQFFTVKIKLTASKYKKVLWEVYRKVLNYLLLAVDLEMWVFGSSGCKLSSFDTIDRFILLRRLEEYVGIKGTALSWFSSYLKGKSFSVAINDFSSVSAACTCGVPQGSVLGPVLFSLYLLPLAKIFCKHQISYHFHADDIQL